ncbi:anthranilate phosphoribosyltransferase [Ponticaulis koreensis]|uniref:anthranilate phosphoribosyltransferase n=1 Tax=Ponticaulis koreensis TaxID=1123045 RepID=UPI0003B6ED19|nr:anthranilate phosphoribosyltransferase [Ponticaulis koreensis]
MTDVISNAIKSIARKESLSVEILEGAFSEILSGEVPPERIGAFLMGLAVRGETSTELLAGARIMRRTAKRIKLDGVVLDTCGTGGLGWASLNTSTASAIVTAACGVTVAKHGNRSVPPKTGSADVLEALGVGLDISEEQFLDAIRTAGIGFLFARSHHSAMRHVAPVRASLGIRTVFNLLGPLSNPAGASHQILGVYDSHWLRPMAETLQALEIERAWVVHGKMNDGLAIDELSIAGETLVVDVTENGLDEIMIHPSDAGLPVSPLSTLRGGTPDQNAKAITDLFSDKASPFRDAVVLNAAAGLHLTGKATTLCDGAEMASDAIASGAARETLNKLKAATS